MWIFNIDYENIYAPFKCVHSTQGNLSIAFNTFCHVSRSVQVRLWIPGWTSSRRVTLKWYCKIITQWEYLKWNDDVKNEIVNLIIRCSSNKLLLYNFKKSGKKSLKLGPGITSIMNFQTWMSMVFPHAWSCTIILSA